MSRINRIQLLGRVFYKTSAPNLYKVFINPLYSTFTQQLLICRALLPLVVTSNCFKEIQLLRMRSYDKAKITPKWYGAFFLSKFNLLVVFTCDLRSSKSIFLSFNHDIRFSTSTFVSFKLDSRFPIPTFVLFKRDVRFIQAWRSFYSSMTFVYWHRCLFKFVICFWDKHICLSLTFVFQAQHSF